jgi:hypothetical protein
MSVSFVTLCPLRLLGPRNTVSSHCRSPACQEVFIFSAFTVAFLTSFIIEHSISSFVRQAAKYILRDVINMRIIYALDIFLSALVYKHGYYADFCNYVSISRNGYFEVPIYFLKAKQGYTVRKTEKHGIPAHFEHCVFLK